MRQARAAARRSGRVSAAPWIVMAVAAIVLGLIGMHVLRDVEPTHGAPTSGATTAVSAEASPAPAVAAAGAVAAGSATSEAGLTGQERADRAPAEEPDTAAPLGGCLDLVSVCVLALLLTFAFVIRRTSGRTSTLSKRAFHVLRAGAPGRPHVDPPSLLELSVLRT